MGKATAPDEVALRPVIPLIGQAGCIHALRRLLTAVARRQCNVLIHGESGTGKELVAHHIHASSARAGGPFVPVDCTTLRDTLFESQLFGHVRGAFTGAEHNTVGFLRSAEGGTLFLDEIGELELPNQAKLLRCLQDRAVVPLGTVRPVPIDVRIIAATHRDLWQMVQQGRFREDLFYRLNVVKVEVPPLRQRIEDIPALGEWFLRQQAELYGEPQKGLSPAVVAALCGHHWPGNVRELANAIEHAYVLSESDRVELEDLPEPLRSPAALPVQASLKEDSIMTLEAGERHLIARALQATAGNQIRAARLLDIHRHRLARKIRLYSLENLLGGAMP